MSDIMKVDLSVMSTKVDATPKEILEGKPSGATHYAIIGGVGVGDVGEPSQVIYLFKSPYGFRQIKENLIGFACTGIPTSEIKCL